MEKETEKGFTFVETLVAITVMLLVIIGPMTVAQKGIQTAYFATEQATATFLAQEAIEAVRESRDDRALEVFKESSDNPNSVLKTSTWSESCSACSSYSGVLYIDSDGRYTHSNLGAPRFTRTVTLSESTLNSGTAVVTVKVSWQAQIFGGDSRTVELKTWIYDHYRRYE